MRTKILAALAVLAIGGFGALLAAVARIDATTHGPVAVPFGTDRAAIAQLIAYDRQLKLTPRQERLATEALERLPSFCMSHGSAAHRCCGCNAGRASWGLAKYLLVEKGYRVQDVRASIAAWQAAAMPKSGAHHRCPSTHCFLALHENGCAGMDPAQITD
jgi:hypothetical protein